MDEKEWEAVAIETKKREKEALISYFQQWVNRMVEKFWDSDEEIKEVIFNFLDSELPDFLKRQRNKRINVRSFK